MEYIIKVMDLRIKINVRYNLLKSRIEKYIDDDNVSPIDFNINISDDILNEEYKKYVNASIEDVEYMLTGAVFYIKILEYDAFLIHSSSVYVNDFAYSFSANSGVGKSTHTSLYLKYFNNSFIINDDKPAYRLIDNKCYVYGTPWSGKHDISKNVKIPLKSICFIKHGVDNKVVKLSNKDAISKILNQTIKVKGFTSLDKLLYLLDKLVSNYNIYEISCDISQNAVMQSYKAMNEVIINE